jgi:esterase/lipase
MCHYKRNNMNPTTNKLFIDPGLSYPMDNLDLPFADYIGQCKTLIENTRCDLNTNAEVIIQANTPFELTPTSGKARYGALLIHGLYDSPFVMRDLGTLLQAEGMLVRSVLLPGHGTVPGALLNVSYQDWIKTVHYGISNLALDVDKIFLVGFSTGATLAMYHMLNGNFPNIAGVISIAPAIKISPLARLAGLLAKSSQTWLHQDTEIDYAKYRSFTYNSAYQIFLLTNALNKLFQTKAIKTPQLIVISQNDKTVRSKATLDYFNRYASLSSQLILYKNSTDSLTDHRITLRPTVYKALNIVDMSHVAMPIAPDNAHYGKQGDYTLASHIDDNLQQGGEILYGTYNTLQNDILNQLHKTGLIKHERVRLSFNPDFDFLREAIIKFIDKTTSFSPS